jgi:arylsulfatase A-like enzyme
VQSTQDNKPYENNIPGGDNTFPHLTDTITRNRYETFRFLPYANTYTFETARAAMEAEQLGKRGVTDMLAISFSTPDYLGHATGPNSIEVEDMYLRFDKDLGAFMKYLDASLGRNNYILFITADHAVAHIPAFMRENKMHGGTFSTSTLRQRLNNALQQQFNVGGLVTSIMNYQVYLDDKLVAQNKLDKQAIKQMIMDSLIQVPAVSQVVDLASLQTANIPDQLRWTLTNGFNQKLSGDVQYVLKPNFFDGGSRGTTHGSWNPYDSHIPMLWFGWNIKAGRSNREMYMSDIAPTIAALLQIQMPNATTGKAMQEVMKK